MNDPRARYRTVRRVTASLLYLVITLTATTVLVYLALTTLSLVRSVWAFSTG